MKMRHVRMPENLWEAMPDENRSEWIRTAIRMRIARDQYGLKDEYIEALNESQNQIRRVGITLNQISKNLHISLQNENLNIPVREITDAIKKNMKDVKRLKEMYFFE